MPQESKNLKRDKNEYGLNLGRFLNHKRRFPWMFLLKIIIGLGMIAFLYFFSRRLFEQKNSLPPDDGIEVEVQTG